MHLPWISMLACAVKKLKFDDFRLLISVGAYQSNNFNGDLVIQLLTDTQGKG